MPRPLHRTHVFHVFEPGQPSHGHLSSPEHACCSLRKVCCVLLCFLLFMTVLPVETHSGSALRAAFFRRLSPYTFPVVLCVCLCFVYVWFSLLLRFNHHPAFLRNMEKATSCACERDVCGWTVDTAEGKKRGKGVTISRVLGFSFFRSVEERGPLLLTASRSNSLHTH